MAERLHQFLFLQSVRAHFVTSRRQGSVRQNPRVSDSLLAVTHLQQTFIATNCDDTAEELSVIDLLLAVSPFLMHNSAIYGVLELRHSR